MCACGVSFSVVRSECLPSVARRGVVQRPCRSTGIRRGPGKRGALRARSPACVRVREVFFVQKGDTEGEANAWSYRLCYAAPRFVLSFVFGDRGTAFKAQLAVILVFSRCCFFPRIAGVRCPRPPVGAGRRQHHRQVLGAPGQGRNGRGACGAWSGVF